MFTNLKDKRMSALVSPSAAAYASARRDDVSVTAFPWQDRVDHEAGGAGAGGERNAAVVEGWLNALERSFGSCVRMIPAGSELTLSGNGPVCRTLDVLQGPRALCRQVHRSLNAAGMGSGCAQSVRCPLGFLLVSIPVQAKGSRLGQIEFGPMVAGQIDHAEFARSLGRLGVASAMWPPLQLSLSALNIIRDENIEGVLALLQRVASVVAEEVTRASASAPVHVPLAVAEGRRFAEQHLGGRIALTDVARHVGLSADHFSRLFRCALGIPFGEYVNRCRVEHAQRILAGSSRRVAEVAYACGFESVPHFNRVFRRVTGTSPTRFRRPVPELQPTGASRAVVLF